MLATSLVLAALAVSQPPAVAAPKIAKTFPLYEGKAPHAVGDSPTDKPSLDVYPAPMDKANGAAIVVCPGGGYGGLAMNHEGTQVAEFLNSLGIHCFVLKYRIAQKDRPGPLQPAPMLDVQRAIRLVRAHAGDYGIDTRRVGLMGFSAGGHLASTGGTHFDEGKPDGDAIDKHSCRPDFLILGYPVISMDMKITHGGTRHNLLGRDADPKLVELYSNEKQVTEKTPPTFIFHTSEDSGVVPENAIRFYLACLKAKVPVELHLYEKGRHGVGIVPKNVSPGTDTWRFRLAEWLTDRGVTSRTK